MQCDWVVHVIDDDDAARESLAFLLEASHLSVRSYESAATFLAALPELEPGCVITDARMPEIDGLELLRRLKSQRIGWPVIVITGHGDVALAVEALREGAVDFIEKPFDDEVLLNAIQSALGRTDRHVDAARESTETRARLATLSSRERQVMEALVAGHPSKRIAEDLGVDARTVEVCRASVMAKLQARGHSHLVRMAVLAGL